MGRGVIIDLGFYAEVGMSNVGSVDDSEWRKIDK
jgi:hypothetical protein